MSRETMERFFSSDATAGSLSLFEDVLDKGALLRVRVTGRSMTPFLRGDEVVTIRKVPSSSLRKGDLILFRSRKGYPVLHRIIRKRREEHVGMTFQTKGDALVIPDEPVRDKEILGKVCRIENGLRYIDLEAGIWSTLNYLFAAVSLLESRLGAMARALKHTVRIGRVWRRGGL